MVSADTAALEPPVPPVPWSIHACNGVSWRSDDGWHYIFGTCAVKHGPMLDLGQDPHRSCCYGLNFLCSGRGRFRDWHGREFLLEPGMAFQRLPDLPHTVWIDDGEPWIESWVSIRRRTYDHLHALGQVGSRPVYRPRDPGAVRDGFRDLFQRFEQGTSADAPALMLAFQRILQDVRNVAADTPVVDPHQEVVRAACRRLDCGLHEPLDLHALAAELGVGYEHFRKLFKARIGLAPGAYRAQKRIDRACALLMHTQKPVAAVAEDLGYSDAFAFSARFKQVVGVSPSAYRRRVSSEPVA